MNNETGSGDEGKRLEALYQCRVLDTCPETQFDDIAALAADICDTPMAIVTLIDEKRQWFKSRIGVDICETPREIAFCNAAVRRRAMFVVPDAQRDPDFMHNPMVTGEPFIRFYAGAPLITDYPRGLRTRDTGSAGPRAACSVRPPTSRTGNPQP